MQQVDLCSLVAVTSLTNYNSKSSFHQIDFDSICMLCQMSNVIVHANDHRARGGICFVFVFVFIFLFKLELNTLHTLLTSIIWMK